MLVHRVPYPPNRGDRIRSYHLLRFLAQRADVWLATLADEPLASGTRQTLESLCRQVAIEPLGPGRWLRAAASLALGGCATAGLFASPALRRTIRHWSRQTRWDAALVYCSSMAPYLDLPELAGLPAVIDLVDVDSQKFYDYAALAHPPRRWLYRLEGRRLRQLECRLPQRSVAITLVSEAEAELFRRLCPTGRVLALPNGVDLDYFRPTPTGPNPWQPLAQADRTHLVFVGALDYHANVDGVTWFVREVWPQLRQALPQLTLGLVGRKPVPAVQKLAQVPGVRVFANVPDVRPYLAAADVAIAPLRVARGIQNKVLEAMAMAKPVVASPQAAEGLTATEATAALLVAYSPTAWIEQILRLFVDRSHRAARGCSGRDYVTANHAWHHTLAPLEQVLPPPLNNPKSHATPAAVTSAYPFSRAAASRA